MHGFGGRCRGGFGRGGGRGIGVRGSTSTWPYVGRGRGGLPRCAYYWDAVSPGYWGDPYSAYTEPEFASPYWGEPEAASRNTREQDIDFLKDAAEMLKQQLEDIEARVRGMETKRAENVNSR